MVTAGEWQVKTTIPLDEFRGVVSKVVQEIGHAELSYLGNVAAGRAQDYALRNGKPRTDALPPHHHRTNHG